MSRTERLDKFHSTDWLEGFNPHRDGALSVPNRAAIMKANRRVERHRANMAMRTQNYESEYLTARNPRALDNWLFD